ncbi:MAG: PorP/SprF family type IX secretion system membrane protein [Flavipsychrobacter sp.]
MIKKLLKGITVSLTALLTYGTAAGQGMHFSQYYNAPMLLNPANTALMSQSDYRIGANYRSQWAQLPVPYNTMSGFADFSLFKKQDFTNWLGVGVAFFNDKAGDGQLTLNRTELAVAYHILTGEYNMISVGFSASTNQRSIDFSKLTYDRQWDGFKFDKSTSNGEPNTVAKTNFWDMNAGINYALFPNENLYLKVGIGLAHINQPQESFLGNTNQIKMRPTANVDALIKLDGSLILNPSAYYTRQGSAQELVYGLTARFFISGNENYSTDVIVGVYNRFNESIIPVFGLQWSGVRLMASYDYTISKLGPDVNGRGAVEFGLVYQGGYRGGGMGHSTIDCPRF